MADVSPVVFLFDLSNDAAVSRADGNIDVAFLRALKRSDEGRAVRSRISRGGLLISHLCYKPARVFSEQPKVSAKTGQRTHSSGIEMNADKKLFALLIGDLCDAFAEQWSTLDLVALPRIMGRSSIECVLLSSVSPVPRAVIDQCLREFPLYVGAVEPDFGNPLQRRLFAEFLISDAYVERGELYMPLGDEGFVNGIFDGAEEYAVGGVTPIPGAEFNTKRPPLTIPDVLSQRGLLTLARLQNRLALDVHQRVAQAIDHDLRLEQEFSWDVRQLPNAPDEVEVQSRKLTEYLLNPEHEDGHSKAKFFEQALGLRKEDAPYLQPQLIDALSGAVFEKVRIGEHGIQFSAVLPIRGKNGQSATIETAWIIRPGERASLVTAVPAKKDEALEANAEEPPVIPSTLQGNARWQALYALAKQRAERAEASCVPTPMKIEGYAVIMDGECGVAYVTVPDARKGFARWLRINGHGDTHYKGGVSIYAETNSQSVDKAMAYATAFAKVLRLNGIECSTSSYST